MGPITRSREEFSEEAENIGSAIADDQLEKTIVPGKVGIGEDEGSDSRKQIDVGKDAHDVIGSVGVKEVDAMLDRPKEDVVVISQIDVVVVNAETLGNEFVEWEREEMQDVSAVFPRWSEMLRDSVFPLTDKEVCQFDCSAFHLFLILPPCQPLQYGKRDVHSIEPGYRFLLYLSLSVSDPGTEQWNLRVYSLLHAK